eukprot:7688141-Karenia_brevis.AAC.1
MSRDAIQKVVDDSVNVITHAVHSAFASQRLLRSRRRGNVWRSKNQTPPAVHLDLRSARREARHAKDRYLRCLREGLP